MLVTLAHENSHPSRRPRTLVHVRHEFRDIGAVETGVHVDNRTELPWPNRPWLAVMPVVAPST